VYTREDEDAYVQIALSSSNKCADSVIESNENSSGAQQEAKQQQIKTVQWCN